MLLFDNISLKIDDKTLIYPTSGEVLANKLIVLTGSSGSGKSLLLRLFSSLLAPTTGQILWQNQPLSQITPSRWRSEIGFIQQHSELIDGTVLDNLALPFSLNFYKNQKFNMDFHIPLLEKLGKSTSFLQQASHNLSGGERQIVNLLRCLQLQPKLLLLDEPTSALDSHRATQVVNILIKWQQHSQHSIIWISHDTAQIEQLLANNAQHWQMDNGRLSCF